MANRYWVGGTAAWDGTAGSKWATTSGGGGGSAVPTAADDVFFDASSGSGTTTVQTVNGVCRSLNCTGYTGTLARTTGIVIGDGTAGAGGIALAHSSGMTTSGLGAISFVSTATSVQTVDIQNKPIGGGLAFTGVGGRWKMLSAHTSTSANIQLTGGELDLNGQTMSIRTFSSTGASVRSLIWSGGTISLSVNGAFTFSGSNFSATADNTATFAAAGNSTMTVTTGGVSMPNLTKTSSAGTLTFQDAWTSFGTCGISNSGGTIDFNGKTITTNVLTTSTATAKALTFGAATVSLTGLNLSGSNLTFTANTSSITITPSGATTITTAGVTFSTLIIIPPGGVVTGVTGSYTAATHTITGPNSNSGELRWSSSGTVTVTGTLTMTGNSAAKRLNVGAIILGTAVTLNAATVSLTDVNFIDITGAGAATWSGTRLSNAGGNTSITFPAAVRQFWVGGSGNVSDITHWASSSGGAGSSGRVPYAHDPVTFNSSSGSGSCTMDQSYNFGDLTVSSGCSVLVGFASVLPGSAFCGDIDLNADMADLGPSFVGRCLARGARTINLRGFKVGDITWTGPAATYTLNGNYNCISGGVGIQGAATLDLVSYDMTIGYVILVGFSTAGILKMGSGTVHITGTGAAGSICTMVPGSTVDGGTSTLKVEDTSATAKTISWTNVNSSFLFNVDVATGSGGLTFNSGIATNEIPINGTLTVHAPGKVTFRSTHTQTVAALVGSGASSGSRITVAATTGASKATITLTTVPHLDHADVNDNTAAGAGSPAYVTVGTGTLTNTSNWGLEYGVTAASDTAGLTDAMSAGPTAVVSDNDGLTDALASMTIAAAVAEAEGITDTRAMAVGSFVGSESEGLSDAMSAGPVVGASDNEGLTDSASVAVGVVAAEPEGMTDPQVMVIGATMNESEGLTDAASAGPVASVVDGSGLTDAASTAVGVNAAELEGLADATAETLAMSVADVEGLTDVAVAGLGVVSVEQEAIVDLLSLFIAAAATDSEGLEDDIDPVFNMALPNDGLDLSDAASAGVSLVLTEGEGFTDLAVLALAATLGENVALADLPSAQIGVSTSDNLGLTDSILLAFGAIIAELYGLSDAVIQDVVVELQETSGLSDAINLAVGVTLVESEGLTDTVDTVFIEGLVHVHLDLTMNAIVGRVQVMQVLGRELIITIEKYEIDSGMDNGIGVV